MKYIIPVLIFISSANHAWGQCLSEISTNLAKSKNCDITEANLTGRVNMFLNTWNQEAAVRN